MREHRERGQEMDLAESMISTGSMLANDVFWACSANTRLASMQYGLFLSDKSGYRVGDLATDLYRFSFSSPVKLEVRAYGH